MSFTVTATQTGSTAGGMQLRVKVLTGALPASAQNGSTATQAGAAAHQQSITPTQTGSIVYGAVFNVGATSLTAASGTTLFDNFHNTDGIQFGTLRTTGTSTSGTPETVGCSAPTNAGLLAIAEILQTAGQTLTEDASSPAVANSGSGASTITTAAFTPPPGSLLVAMIGSNGGAGTVSITMTDTSGLGLTWVALVANHPTASGSTYVYVATVPPLAGTGRQVAALRRPPARAIVRYGTVGSGVAVPYPVFPAGTVPPHIYAGSRRTTVRARIGYTSVGAGIAGGVLNIGPPAYGGLVVPRRLRSIRGYQRWNEAPPPPLGKAVVSGLVVPRRQDGKRPTTRSVTGVIKLFGPPGTVPPHIFVARRPPVRVFWSGAFVIGVIVPVRPVTGIGVSVTTGPVSLQWGSGPVSTQWKTGPVSTS